MRPLELRLALQMAPPAGMIGNGGIGGRESENHGKFHHGTDLSC